MCSNKYTHTHTYKYIKHNSTNQTSSYIYTRECILDGMVNTKVTRRTGIKNIKEFQNTSIKLKVTMISSF